MSENIPKNLNSNSNIDKEDFRGVIPEETIEDSNIQQELRDEVNKNLQDIEKNAEKFFEDVDELRGGDFKDVLMQKILYKWHYQYKNFDYVKKVLENAEKLGNNKTENSEEINEDSEKKKKSAKNLVN